MGELIKYLFVTCVREATMLAKIGYGAVAASSLILSLSTAKFGWPSAGIPWWIYALICIGAIGLFLIWIFLKRSHTLDKEKEPKLSISKPIMYTSPGDAGWRAAIRTYKLRITNDSTEQICNCSVKLTLLKNKKGRESHELQGMEFKPTKERPANLLSFKFTKAFDIRGGDWEDVDIIQLDETKKSDHILMMYATQAEGSAAILNLIPVVLNPHALTLRIVADNAPAIEKRYKITVKNGNLRMMPRK